VTFAEAPDSSVAAQPTEHESHADHSDIAAECLPDTKAEGPANGEVESSHQDQDENWNVGISEIR
jgi:hypothetical protein